MLMYVKRFVVAPNIETSVNYINVSFVILFKFNATIN